MKKEPSTRINGEKIYLKDILDIYPTDSVLSEIPLYMMCVDYISDCYRLEARPLFTMRVFYQKDKTGRDRRIKLLRQKVKKFWITRWEK